MARLGFRPGLVGVPSLTPVPVRSPRRGSRHAVLRSAADFWQPVTDPACWHARGEAEAVLVALLKIAKAEGIQFSWIMGGTLLAEIQARTGRGDNALSLAQEIAEDYVRLNYQLNSTLNNAVLGLAQWVTGDVEEAQRSVQKALESRVDSSVNQAWSEWIGSQVLGRSRTRVHHATKRAKCFRAPRHATACSTLPYAAGARRRREPSSH